MNAKDIRQSNADQLDRFAKMMETCTGDSFEKTLAKAIIVQMPIAVTYLAEIAAHLAELNENIAELRRELPTHIQEMRP
jgi:hypothetical protein